MTQISEIEKDLARWSRQRWVFCVLLIFGLQAGGIYWASQGDDEGAPVSRASARVVLGNSARAELMAAPAVDPMLFAGADIAGFSGHGWLEPRSWNYQSDGLAKRTEYLRFAEGARILKEPPPQGHVHNVAGGGIFGAAPSSAQPLEPRQAGRSRLHVEGMLRERGVASAPELPIQTANDVLNSSVIEVGVNGDGLVVSARLAERSRSKTADQQALALARQVRFQATPGSSPELTWGKLIFQWFAVNLASTNAASR